MERKNNDDKDFDKSINENENTPFSESFFHKLLAYNQEILKNFAYVTAFLSTVTLMLGYGVAFEAESRFSLPHASLYESVFDLIDLGSSVAITQLFISLANIVFCLDIVQMYKLTWLHLFSLFLFISLLCGFGYWIKPRKPESKKSNKSCFPKLLKNKTEDQRKIIRIYAASTGCILAIPSIFKIIFFFVPFILIFFVIIIPYKGHQLAADYFYTNVISAKQCKQIDIGKNNASESSKDSQQCKSQLYPVNCVIVNNGKEEIGRGYVALSTSKSLLLYNPNTHEAVRVPIENAKIKTVTDLSEKNEKN